MCQHLGQWKATKIRQLKQDWQRTYKCTIEACTRNHCCLVKAISGTHLECVSVAIVIQQTKHIRRIIVICGLSRSATILHIISQMTRFKKKNYWILNRFSFYLHLLSETFLNLRRIQRNRSSCKVAVILVRC